MYAFLIMATTFFGGLLLFDIGFRIGEKNGYEKHKKEILDEDFSTLKAFYPSARYTKDAQNREIIIRISLDEVFKGNMKRIV